MSICGQRLLMQADMAVCIHIHNRQNVVAVADELARQRRITVRQIQQNPVVMALFLQALQRVSELLQGLLV